MGQIKVGFRRECDISSRGENGSNSPTAASREASQNRPSPVECNLRCLDLVAGVALATVLLV